MLPWPQVGLERAGVVAGVGEGVAAGLAHEAMASNGSPR